MAWKVERTIAGRTLSIESGKMARQADGAVVVTYGETVVLVTAVAQPPRQALDFFPLTLEYREKQCAAGKFPGGVIKREGRPTTKETITMRLNDRPIRPLFPDDYSQDVQVVATVLSADKENDPDVLSMVGSSAALTISDIPFMGPTGSCRVGLVDDEFVINPTHQQRESSELELIVCGTAEALVMVDGSAQIIPEDDVLTAIGLAQDVNVEIVGMISELAEMCGRPTRAYGAQAAAGELVKTLEPQWGERVAQASRTAGKLARGQAFHALRQEAVEQLCNEADESAPTQRQVKEALEELEGAVVRRQVLSEGVRYDGRAPDDVRDIQCEVAVLPRTHGSALFTRGETQALVTTTLGTVRDEQRVLDPLIEQEAKKFMVHYNFPPFCVGEVKPIRGPGRREIGHGVLAEKALAPVLPGPEEFPYTIRLVSDILESNGSSSMATVCGGTLSMMDAGIAIRDPVAGLAMGLVVEDGQNVILTDITGTEDHFTDMDFKLAGTQHGLTALQLDVKIAGISPELIREVMTRGKQARMEILRRMLETLREPRPSISPHAPLLHRMKINIEKIGLLIGPGGKNIRKLEADFVCGIEVEDDGTVTLSGDSDADMEGAIRYMETLAGGGLEIGKIYEGTVTEVRDFGAIVEVLPGMDGLCHVSQLADGFVKNVQDVCKVGDRIRVKVLSIDGNRVKLSRKAALQEQDGQGGS